MKVVYAVALVLLTGLFVSSHAADADATPALTQETIDAATIENLKRLPNFLIAPAATYAERFANDSNLVEAILFAACMIFIGISAAYVLNVTKKVELSSLAFVYVGTVVLWIFYAVFLHGIAYLAGARRGIEYTVAAYLYVVGSLQPVLAVLLWGISQLYQKKVDFREIRSLGFSSASAILARGKFFSTDVNLKYRIVSGVLIMAYFAIALVPAQQLSGIRVTFAVLGALLLFCALGGLVYAYARIGGKTKLVRLFSG